MSKEKMIVGVKDKVPHRCWYYLLDFGGRDEWKILKEFYGVEKLHELTLAKFWNYFHVATQSDIQNYNKTKQP